MRILALLHAEQEHAGAIRRWASEKGHVLTEVLWPELSSPPPLDQYHALVVMGGPMGVYEVDRYPWIQAEVEYLQQAIPSRPCLGICLGSQLIAAALGAEVRPSGLYEIGWFPVTWTPVARSRFGLPERSMVLHWHGDTFALPKGAEPLAHSDSGLLQGFFSPPATLALQFHLEVEGLTLQDWVQADADYLQSARLRSPEWVQDPQAILEGAQRHNQQLTTLLGILLERWLQG